MSEIKGEKKKRVKATRTLYRDSYLHTITLNQLEKAKAEQDGHRFRWLIPAMAFSAFRVEALCNIYGSSLFPHWEHYESSSFIGKVVMISEFLKIEVDFSREPWQTLNQMKRFRNALVHLKPITITETFEVPEGLPNRYCLPSSRGNRQDLMGFSSVENAEKFDSVATELDMVWMNNARALGLEISRIGETTHEELQ